MCVWYTRIVHPPTYSHPHPHTCHIHTHSHITFTHTHSTFTHTHSTFIVTRTSTHHILTHTSHTHILQSHVPHAHTCLHTPSSFHFFLNNETSRTCTATAYFSSTGRNQNCSMGSGLTKPTVLHLPCKKWPISVSLSTSLHPPALHPGVASPWCLWEWALGKCPTGPALDQPPQPAHQPPKQRLPVAHKGKKGSGGGSSVKTPGASHSWVQVPN